MALVVNSNISSLNAQRQLASSGSDLNTAAERLASGRRINSAADDAAGLAISNRQTSQIRGLDQAIRNANDGVSLIKTAEGALQETTNILQRMRELSIQSANGIYSDTDRATLDAEVQQLVSELDRIATTTSFNGQNILDGSLGKVDLQIGAQANQTIQLEVQAVDADTLGMGSTSVDMMGDDITIANIDLSENTVLINGQSIVKGLETYDGTTDDLDELVGYINDNVNGVTASTYAEGTATDAGDGILDTGDTFTVDITNLDGTTTSVQVTDTENLQELADKLNDESGGLLSASITDDGYLSIAGNNVTDITVTDATGAGGTGLNGTTYEAKLVLASDNGDPITITRGAVGSLDDLNALGFQENTDSGTVEGYGIAAPTNSWGVGDVAINGVDISATDTDSLSGKIDNINDVTDETGVSATAFSTAEFDFAAVDVTDLTTVFNMNGTEIDLTTATDLADVADTFNAETDVTGITASVSGTRIILEGNVASITFADGAGAVATGLGDSGGNIADMTTVAGDGTATTADVADGDVVDGGIKLTSTNGNPISVEIGNNATAADIGLLETNATAGGSFGTAISNISIDTQSNAQKAIDVIDNALETLNDIRSGLGAVSNRLDFTISNLSNVSENASAARSQIVDADFAKETAELSRAQVLQQASQAMLAQANARPQQVLQLLQ